MVFVYNCKDSDSECRIAKQSLSVMPNASYFRSFFLQRYVKVTYAGVIRQGKAKKKLSEWVVSPKIANFVSIK